MNPIRPSTARRAYPSTRAQGFSLLEIMIALTLGLLLSIGIMSLFNGTSRTNKLQDGLARLQENGRFAVTRIEQDLRMLSAQYCSNTTGSGVSGAAVPLLPARAPMIYASDLNLPDSQINSIGADGNPTTDSASTAYVLSPRWFMQGYSCDASTCTPAVPSGPDQIPDMGTAADRRVPASDVLTVRYQRGTGWPVAMNACGIGAADTLADGTAITLSPQTGDDPISSLQPGLALISDCVSPAVVPISSVAGNTVQIGATPDTSTGILGAAQGFAATGALCRGNRTRDVRLFDFSGGFVTVSYYLAFREDDNPDARPNSAAAKRLIPVLIRRENGVEQELVRGVDQLRFRFGVLDNGGNLRFLLASDVEARTDCPAPPPGTAMEPGCMWRSVRTIEPHLLVNTVDEVFGLDDASREYHFDSTVETPGDATPLPSGIRAGSQPRREFVTYVTGRNHSF